jgi:chromate transporter
VSYLSIFLKFLRFGCLAWGGPVAQINMLREDLVEREKWIEKDKFKRVLAVYQALPGPEAHELCVYFGMVKARRIGGLLAGLGFMLPGLVLMLLLAWAYLSFGSHIHVTKIREMLERILYTGYMEYKQWGIVLQPGKPKAKR